MSALSPSGGASGITNTQGAYALLSLAPDTYVITVEVAGYKRRCSRAHHIALGGSGGVDQAYSGLALVPGVYVPQGQQGWYQPMYIRGGDQDQIGCELDASPANRSYDNAPMSLLSNIGTQELQVYTGPSPRLSDLERAGRPHVSRRRTSELH